MIMKPLTDRKWRGYSFEELQDQLLVNDVRIKIQKKRIEKAVKPIQEVGKKGENIARTVFSLLNYVDYFRLGYGMVRKLKKIFKRKNK